MSSLRWAWRELRMHPGRFAATLLAIVASSALLAATQVFAATETSTIAKRATLYAAKADVVIDSHLWNSSYSLAQRDFGLEAARTSLAQNPNVAACETFSRFAVPLNHGSAFATVMLTASPVDDGLRWYTPSQGRLPTSTSEIVLTTDTAATLGVSIGDTVTPNVGLAEPLTVVGLSDEPGYAQPPAYALQDAVLAVGDQLPPRDTRVIIDPKSTARLTPGSSGSGVGLQLLVRATDPAAAPAIVEETQRYLTEQGFLKIIVQPKLAAEIRDQAAQELAAGTDWMGTLLLACGLLALLAGGLMIATTFSILLAQRRRQIGLLRAVGASRPQVAARFVLEALLLGIVGTLLGLPLGIGLAALAAGLGTHTLAFGLEIPWWRLVLTLALTVLVTVAAAALPSVRATRSSPLEALRPAAAPADARRASLRRGGVAAALALASVAAVAAGFSAAAAPAWLIPTGLSLGLLAVGFASPFLVPAAIGWLARGVPGPTVRLGASNARRNPARTGATASAVILTLGVIVAVQAGMATGRQSALASIDAHFPADLTLQSAVPELDLTDPNGSGPPSQRDDNGLLAGFPSGALTDVRATPGVLDAQLYPVTERAQLWASNAMTDPLPLSALPPSADALLRHPLGVSDGQIGLPADIIKGLTISTGSTLTVQAIPGEQLLLTVVECNLSSDLGVVTESTLARLKTPTHDGLIVARLADTNNADTIVSSVTGQLVGANPGVVSTGSAQDKAALRSALDGVTALLTGLLAVAAAVSLVGVGNTLGLSVIERTREFGLLRALGLSPGGIRRLLLVEAVLVSAAWMVIGLVVGLTLGWTGAAAIAHAFVLPPAAPTIDPGWVVIGCVVVLAAGAAASILPGRAAAAITPIEAMQDLG